MSFVSVTKTVAPLINPEEAYEAIRERFTNSYMQECAENLEYVEVNLIYHIKEFSLYTFNRINYKPSKPTMIKAVFCTRAPSRNFIEVFVGSLQNEEDGKKLLIDGTDDPKGLSIFTLVIRFDNRLIEAMNFDKVKTIEEFMDNVPLCCLNIKLKKLLWEELHNNQAHLIQSRVHTSGVKSPEQLKYGLQRTEGAKVIVTLPSQDNISNQLSTSEFNSDDSEIEYKPPPLRIGESPKTPLIKLQLDFKPRGSS